MKTMRVVGFGRFLGVAALLLILSVLLASVISPAASAITKSEPVELTVPETRLEVRGYASPNALVQIANNGSLAASVIADSSGYFQTTFTSTFGLRTISARYDDQESVASQSVTQQVNATAQTTTTTDFLLPPTLSRRTPATTVSGDIVLSGYSLPSSLISLQLDPLQTRTVVSDANGFYEFRLASTSLAPGTYSAKVSVTFGAQQSDFSELATFTIETQTTTPAPDFSVGDSGSIPPPQAQSPDDGSVIDGDSVVVSGQSLPNAQIVIYQDGVAIGSVFADDQGEWSFVFTATYSPVTLTFEACVEGRCSVLSNTLTMSFSRLNQQCEDVVFELATYRFWEVDPGQVISIDVLLSSGDGVITVDWDDSDNSERFDHDADRPRSYTHRYDDEGFYNGTIRFASGDCSVTRYFTVHVVDESQRVFSWWLAFWIIVVILPGTIYTYKKGRELMLAEEAKFAREQ